MAYETHLRIGVDSRTGEQSLKRFERRLESTERSGKQVNRTMGRTSDRMRGIATMARSAAAGIGSVAATAGGLTYAAERIAGAARETRNLAEVSRTGVEEFQRMAFGARELGVTQQQLSQVMLDVQDRVGDFLQTGGGEFQDFFENIAPQVGLTADELARMSGPDALMAMYDALEQANLSASETRFYMEALSSDSSRLIPLLKDNAEGFRESANRADEMNAVLSKTEIDNLSELSDEMGELRQQFTAELASSVAKNADEIEGLANSLFSVAEAGFDAADGVGSFVSTVKESGIGQEVEQISSALPAMVSAIMEVSGQARAARGIMSLFDDGEGDLGRIDPIIIRDYGDSVTDSIGPVRTLSEEMDNLGKSIPDLEVRTLTEETRRLEEVASNRAAEILARDLDEIRRIADPGTESLKELGNQLDTLSRSGLPEQRVDQLRIGLIEAAEGGSVLVDAFNDLDEAASRAGGDSGEQFAGGFERQATRIGDSLADSLITGDWGGVGDTIGAAVGSSISDSIAANMGDMASGAAGRMAGSILGGVAGGVAGQLIGSQVDDLLSSDLPERGALAEQKQEQQFTNTILGGIEEQTRSITESTDEMVSALDDLVGANRAMLRSLQSSQRSGSRFTSSALRGLSNTNFGAVDIGALAEAGNTLSGLSDDLIGVFDAITLGANSLLGIDDLVSDAFGSIFGGGTSLQDRGIEIVGGQIQDLIRGTVVNAYEMVEVDGGWLSSDSTERAEQRIGGQIEQQFGNAIAGITDSLVATAETLGMDAGRAASQLEDMQIRTRDISLLDMNAQERQETIQSYFSSVFDTLSGRLFDWTRQFQEAGEGLGETVTRLATQNEVLRESHEQLGFVLNEGAMNAQQFTSTADDFVSMLGGVEAAASQISSFQSSFMTDAQQLESVEGQLNRALEQVNLNLPETRAGFLDLLQAQNAATASGQRNIETILRVQDQADQYYSLLESRQSDAIAEVETAMQSMEREVTQVQSALDSMGSSAAQQEMARLDAVDTLREALATGDLTGVGQAAQAAANINAAQFSTREQFERARGVTANLLSAVEARGENQLSAAERQVDLAEQSNTLNQGQLDSLERIERALTGSSVATFADGGMHTGGARIVGERGPEIEFTGPSRIASNSESRNLLSMDQVVTELREVQNQLQRLNQYGYQTTKNTKKSSERLRRWDNIGQPPEREEL